MVAPGLGVVVPHVRPPWGTVPPVLGRTVPDFGADFRAVCPITRIIGHGKRAA